MTVTENITNIRARIASAAKSAGRLIDDIHLIAVSKVQPQERITASLNAGLRIFGENRVQEAKERWSALKPHYPDLQLHLIGPLQTNKVKDAVALFDMIHTIDRESLVLALSKEMTKQGRYLPCLIQVNIGDEAQKTGIHPNDLPDFLKFCRSHTLDIRGLMCIPPVDDPPALHFALLRKLALEHRLEDLSMGMSDDFEKAIPLGATYIRVGSAIFGAREPVQA
jgi:PLP dependent protein